MSKNSTDFIFTFCHFVDFPDNGTDCSTNNHSICVRCPVRGAYFTGESVHDYNSIALAYFYFIGIVVVIISIFGIVSNAFIIKVISRCKETHRSFDFLLIILAVFDLLSSLATIIAPIGSLSYFGNWYGRGKGTLFWCIASLHTVLFGRSLSTYITILITIERFLMIRFPLRSLGWFTPKKTKIMAISAVIFAIMMNYQRFASWTLEKNNWRDVKSLEELEYILKPTAHGKLWYKTLRGLHNQIDFWLPFPILLFLNLLSYWKVNQLSERRKEMNMKEKRDIRAVRMFLPVVVVYFATNIELIVNLAVILFLKVTYREFYMLMYLSVAINSAVNLPVYYFRNMTFKKEAKKELVECMEMLRKTFKCTKQEEVETVKMYIQVGIHDGPMSDSGNGSKISDETDI